MRETYPLPRQRGTSNKPVAQSRPLEFATEQERREWFIQNADYFTIIRRADRRNYRVEVSSLPLAETAAEGIVKKYPHAKLLIYAVVGASDVWVKNVIGQRGTTK